MPKISGSVPGPVEAAISALGNRPRSQILRWLSQHGPALRYDITEGTGLPAPSVGSHLAILERHGLIRGNVPAGQRRGRSVQWEIEVETVKALNSTHIAYLLGR